MGIVMSGLGSTKEYTAMSDAIVEIRALALVTAGYFNTITAGKIDAWKNTMMNRFGKEFVERILQNRDNIELSWHFTMDYVRKNWETSCYPFKDDPDGWDVYPQFWQLLHFHGAAATFLPDAMLEGIDYSGEFSTGSSRKLLESVKEIDAGLEAVSEYRGKEWFDAAVKLFERFRDVVVDEVENHFGVLVISWGGLRPIDVILEEGTFVFATDHGKCVKGTTGELSSLQEMIAMLMKLHWNDGAPASLHHFIQGNTTSMHQKFYDHVRQAGSTRIVNDEDLLRDVLRVVPVDSKEFPGEHEGARVLRDIHDALRDDLEDKPSCFLLTRSC